MRQIVGQNRIIKTALYGGVICIKMTMGMCIITMWSVHWAKTPVDIWGLIWGFMYFPFQILSKSFTQTL